MLKKDTGGEELPALGNFKKFVTKIVHFRHVSAKIESKNLKIHFD